VRLKLKSRARTPEIQQSQTTSTNASTANDDEKEPLDEVDMAKHNIRTQKGPKKKKEKNNFGGQWIKEKKVMKTKKTMDDNGYKCKYLI